MSTLLVVLCLCQLCSLCTPSSAFVKNECQNAFSNASQEISKTVVTVQDTECYKVVRVINSGCLLLQYQKGSRLNSTVWLDAGKEHRMDCSVVADSVTWSNGTHSTSPLRIESLDINGTAQLYREENVRGASYSAVVTFTDPLPKRILDLRGSLFCSGPSGVSCELTNSTRLLVRGISASKIRGNDVQLQLRCSKCVLLRLPPIPVPVCHRKECRIPCKNPGNVRDVHAWVSQHRVNSTLTLSWLDPADRGDGLALYAIRWINASSIDDMDEMDSFPLSPMQNFDWFQVTELNNSALVYRNESPENRTYQLPLADALAGVRVQIIAKCSDWLDVMRSGNLLQPFNYSIFKDIFQPWTSTKFTLHKSYNPAVLVLPANISSNGSSLLPSYPKDRGSVSFSANTYENLHFALLALIPILLGIFTIIAIIMRKRSARRRKITADQMGILYVNPFYKGLTGSDRYKMRGLLEIPSHRIVWGDVLGQGAFGVVYKACLLSDNGVEDANKVVAIKVLPEHTDAYDRVMFHEEMCVMRTLASHSNIVSLIGCTFLSGCPCIITEFAANGDLLQYLRDRRAVLQQDSCQPSITQATILRFALDITSGMEYISSQGFIHRDLAARNLLVDDALVVKISDFGLTRYMNSNNVYMVRRCKRLPIKWLSLEALSDLTFSSASDVWAFGVVLFELVTLGASPYPAIQPSELLSFLLAGHRMDRPPHCSPELYEVMLMCWQSNPEDRPTFAQLKEILFNMIQDTKINNYINLSSTDSFGCIHMEDEMALTSLPAGQPARLSESDISVMSAESVETCDTDSGHASTGHASEDSLSYDSNNSGRSECGESESCKGRSGKSVSEKVSIVDTKMQLSEEEMARKQR